MLESRKQEERDFHNRLEHDRRSMAVGEYDKRYTNLKYYAITRKSAGVVHDWIRANCPGKTALDYACGLGSTAILMAKNGATAHGIDISDHAIKTASTIAAKAGVGENTRFSVMDAENLTFGDDVFDVAVCGAILHHLDTNQAFRELSRVMKKSGKILCIEALGYNFLINLYRKMTPKIRTAWEPDHILTFRDIEIAKEYFGKIKIRYYHLFSILAVPFRNTPFFSPILTLLEAVDSVVLRIPYVQLLAWQMIFELSEPRKR